MTQSEINKKCDEINAIDLYVNQKMSGKEIGNLIGVTNNGSIFEYLKLHNIPRRKACKREELRETPPIGQTFGLWTVISDITKIDSHRNVLWQCQCKCGNIAWKKPGVLRKGLSTRCKKCGNKNYFTDNGEIDIQALIVSKFNQIKHNLSTRKKVGALPFTITPADIQKLYNENSNCSLSGISMALDLNKPLSQQNLSVDRIDSNKGYEPDNIQLVDKRINMMKQSLSNDEFIELCCKVAEQHGYVKKE